MKGKNKMMVPKQGTRQRVFVLMTFLRDDNGDCVEGTQNILAGTSSDKVGREALETFQKHQNGQVTMVHAPNQERFLPGRIAEVLDDKPEETEALKFESEGSDAESRALELLELVQ